MAKRRKSSKNAISQVSGGQHVKDEVVKSGRYFRQPESELKRYPQFVENRANC